MSASHGQQEVRGVDIYVVQKDLPTPPQQLGACMLKLITNRGTKVWPHCPEVMLSDVHRVRFLAERAITNDEVLDIIRQLEAAGYAWVQAQKLLWIDGKAAYSN